MPTYLVIHTRYTDVQLGLFRAQNLLGLITRESKLVTKCFISDVTELLHQHNLSLKNLDFIAAHQGPAPFTTLRVSLALLNGLAFATDTQLIGVDGLHTFTHEYSHATCTHTIALLNAFCNDIYYGIYTRTTGAFHRGYAPAERFLKETAANITEQIYFIGNGVSLHEQAIKKYFGSQAVIASPVPEIASIESIAAHGLKQWQENSVREYQVMPLYLKSGSPVCNTAGPLDPSTSSG